MGRKTEVSVSFGRYDCLVDRDRRWPGLVINPPLITEWGTEAIREYINFLELLLKELEHCDAS